MKKVRNYNPLNIKINSEGNYEDKYGRILSSDEKNFNTNKKLGRRNLSYLDIK